MTAPRTSEVKIREVYQAVLDGEPDVSIGVSVTGVPFTPSRQAMIDEIYTSTIAPLYPYGILDGLKNDLPPSRHEEVERQAKLARQEIEWLKGIEKNLFHVWSEVYNRLGPNEPLPDSIDAALTQVSKRIQKCMVYTSVSTDL